MPVDFIQTSDVAGNEQSDQILFSKMYFDDIDKITQHFNSEISSGELPVLEEIDSIDLKQEEI